jgi:beta-lactamase regulating signal transducer with metallopeptidase domain/RimJ/RimL family protein N-acetyltransferase
MPAVETLNGFGRWLVPYLGRLSLELAVLAAVVLAAIVALRVRSARLRHVFWGLVLAKPVVTLLVASPFSLYWFLKPPAPPHPPLPAPAVAVAAPRAYTPAPATGYGRAPMARPARPPAPPWWHRLDEHGVVAGAWVLVASLLGVGLLVGFIFVGFLRRTADPQRAGPLSEAAGDAARLLGMRRPVRVSISPVAHGPVLAGVLRPEVLIPRRLAEALPVRQLSLIIAHESAHARRRDNLVLVIQRLAEVFLFFHPAVWLCGWAMRRDAEAACDDAVLAAHADARAEYAGSLVEVAAITREHRAGLARRLLINTFAATETRFTQRVSRILEGRRRRMTLGVSAAALVALMGIGVLGLPTAAAPGANDGGKKKEGDEVAGETKRVRREDGKVWIEGLEWSEKRIAAEIACVEGALECLGADVSPGWLYGATGHAFAINMRPTVCVSSPYAWEKTLYELAPNIGCRIKGRAVSMAEAGDEFPARQREAYDMVRDAIDRGLPCYADRVSPVPDYALITGYDDVGYYYSRLSAGGPVVGGPKPWQELGTEDIEWLDVWCVESCEAGPDDEAVRAALETVLERAATRTGWTVEGDYVSGPEAFDLWADELESGRALLESHAWNAHFWHEYRLMAVQFLKEAKQRLPGRADAAFDDAVSHYTVVRDSLEAVKDLAPFRDEHDFEEKLNAPEAARMVREAGAAERQGLAALAEIVVALGGTVPAMGTERARTGSGEGPHMLEGLELTPRAAAELACVDSALRYLGREVSPAWLFGATGHAFAINMRPTVCVSSPYAWQKTLYELAPNVGCRITGVCVSRREAGDEFPTRQREAWEMVRDAIDRGLPCYADGVRMTPMYELITGYDDVGYYYLGSGWGEPLTGGPTPWQRLGTDDYEVLDVWRVEPCEPAPDDEAVRAALSTVLERAATPDGWTTMVGQRSGPAAFDLWADEVEAGHAVLGNHAWNAESWLELRAMAVEFLKEARQRLPGRADAAFDEAIAHYTVVRDRLKALRDLLPAFGDDADWDGRPESPEQAALLREAGAAERKGLAALGKVLVALGGRPPDLSASGRAERGSGAGKVVARRFVLEGVRRVAYHTDRWRFTPFCNALDACLQYVGEPEQYDYLMCTSGAAFRMNWAPKAWDGGNSDILGMAVETLEPMRHAFRSAGYEMVPVAKAEPDDWAEGLLHDATQHLGGELTEEAGFRRRIIDSINSGRPVVAFGIVGPPEACVITGYGEWGDVLMGWNVFQDDEGVETEPSGYFRVSDWYPRTRGLLLIGDRVDRPDPVELDLETLKWTLEVLRTPRVRDIHAGPAAFDAWAADMLNDEYFPQDEARLRGRLMCHWDSMTVTAFRGGGGATAYLLAAAERNPAMADHLRAAADCFENEDVVHGVAPGEEAQMARLADPAVRREVAESIIHARDMHVEAAGHIEAALLAAGVPEEEIPKPEEEPQEVAGERPGRVVLEDVPKVNASGVDGHYALTPFPGCLQACLEYMGDDLGFEGKDDYPRGPVYDYLMGTTGAAFRLFWQPGWHEDNRSAWAFDEPGEYFRRGFAAAGYEYTLLDSVPEAERPQRFRALLRESIRDRGRPAIAFGVLGPPCETIMAGYDEDGRVAIGWHYWQDHEVGQPGLEFEPNGYFRKRNWEALTPGMVLIGDKAGTPDRRMAYVDALKNALHLIREPMQGSRHSGLAAYDAWAEHILRDEEVAGGGGPGDAYMAHADAADVIAEGRHCASCFLEQAAGFLPEAEEELLAASRCFAAEHDLIWKMWEIASGGRSDEERRKFSDPEARRRIAPIIREARDNDAEAAAHIEAALLTLGVPAEDIPQAESTGLAQDGGGTEPPPSASGKVMLEGLVYPHWTITQLGCLKGCLDYLGHDLSRPWLYGGTSHAFFINVHDNLDVASVTAWDDVFVRDLARNLGVRIERRSAAKTEMGEEDFRAAQMEAWTFVRECILADRPCYGWELKPPYGDFWLITGFDDVGYHYDGHETGGPTPWQSLGDQFIPVLDVRSVQLCEQAPDEVVVRDALVAALEHASAGWGPSAGGGAHVGPEAFDAWADSLEAGRALHNHHAYNAVAWHECREMAAEFLDEAKRRLPGRADAAFDEAIAHYAVVRDKLAAVRDLTPIDNALGWGEEPKLQSPQAAQLVREAGAAEREGLAALAEIVVALGGTPPAPFADEALQQDGGGSDPEGSGEAHMIEGLEYPRHYAAELACVEGALRYLGRDVTPGWLYGATGHAFAINIRQTVCVSSPYAWQKTLYELAPNLGCRLTGVKVSMEEAGDQFPARQRGAWDMVRAAVDAGLPCYADRVFWIPDYALITGYDDVGYYYSHWDQTGGPTPWEKLGTEDIQVLDVWRVETCDAEADDEVVRAALQTVLERAATPDSWTLADDHVSGPAAFDLWADELESGHAQLGGHGFNMLFWQECRAMAVEFLEEAKQRLPGRADAAFDEAVSHYTVVRDRLAEARELTLEQEDPTWTETLQSAEVAARIREAGAAERRGLVALARILSALGGTPPSLASLADPPAGDSAGDNPGPAGGGAGRPERVLIEGVARVGHDLGQWCPFSACFASCLDFLGEEEGDYAFALAMSGSAFRLNWWSAGWDLGNVGIGHMAEDTAEPYRRAFRAAGYGCEVMFRPGTYAEGSGAEATADEATFRARILESIGRGVPVIAIGVVGPPEPCLITGYDEGGDVLIGWGHFQGDADEFEPTGEYRKRDWYGNTQALILIGPKGERPAPSDTYREALEWALVVARKDRVREHYGGAAAYTAWAQAMLRDADFPADDDGVLWERLAVHWDAMSVTMNRGPAAQFLRKVAAAEPAAAEELRAAADCYERAGVRHGVAPGEEDQIARLADRAVRQEVADSILAQRDAYVEAAGHIEAALLALGVAAEDIPQAEPPDLAQDGGGGGPGGAGTVPERVVLEGVPRVGFGVIEGHVAMTPWPACLRACLEYMGDDLGFEDREGGYPRDAVYAYLMGTTGAAFRLLWRPGWHGDNVASWMLSDDPSEIFRRGFAAAGYEQIPSGHLPEEVKEERFRAMVVESVRDRGRPVIAHGVIGPPEEAIIAGYDEGGDVAVGWSFFQDRPDWQEGVELEPNGYFRKRGWAADTWSMMAIGDRTGTPDRRDAYTEALKWALHVMREPVRYGERHSGLAAYDAWAEQILQDDEVAAGPEPPNDPFSVHSDAVDVVAEGRHYASTFLRQAAEHMPEVEEDLLAAADCCKAEHDLMWGIWGIVGGNGRGDEQRQAFLEPDVRRRIAPIIRQARDRDAEATDHVEKALLALGVPTEDIPQAGAPGLAHDGGGLGPGEAGAVPERVVLEDVPRVADGVIQPGVRMTPWPGCLWACLEYTGDDLGFGEDAGEYPREAVYAYLTGTTGTAFRLVWGGWGLDNWASFMTYNDAGEIFRRAYAAIGYEQAQFSDPADVGRAEQFRSRMIESINRGQPLIAHGIIGPPEETIVAGYDEGGAVAIGWSLFQNIPWASPKPDGFEPNGMFRKLNWEAGSMGALGEKTATPERKVTYVEALRNALRIARTPTRGDLHRGLAAYDAWAEHILRDDEIAAGTPDDAFDVHNTAVDTIAEGRHFASIFLKQAAGFLPEAKGELLAAADCYAAECALVERVRRAVGGGSGEEQREAFLEPDVRRRMVPIIEQARDRDAEAAGHIEKALLALGVPAEDIPAVQPPGKVMLEGLVFPHWTITELGCMKGCLDYLRYDVSGPWLYGGTAHAFFINVHDDVDVESVTAWNREFVRDLAQNLGFRVDGHRAVKPSMSEEDFRAAQMDAWTFVRDRILAGRPCYGWELKAPYGDYWLITGFDDVGYYYDGHETGGPTPWQKLGDQFIPVLEVRSVQPCERASDEAVVRDALVAALEHARPGWDPSADGDAHFGPEAYDAWADSLEAGRALHNHHAYNTIAWHECREMAVEFLEEAKRRLPGRADAAFGEAIAHYTVVRDKLAAVKELTPIDNALGWDKEPKLQSPEAAQLVREAGAAEVEGLAALAKIAVALGADPGAVASLAAAAVGQSTAEGEGSHMRRIETARLVLRPFTPDDWRDFHELAVDWQAQPGPEFDKWGTSEEAARGSVQEMSTTDQYLAVCLRESGKVVGLLAINGVDEQKRLDLGHVILSKHQDNDLDREALQALIQHCFDTMDITSVMTHNDPNAEQIGPLLSLGFTNRNPNDRGELVITREEWDQRAQAAAQ